MRKGECPCVALEMDGNACDGCDSFEGGKEMERLLRITFEYKDEWTRGEWRRQQCTVRSVEECVRIYGLDTCEHRIVEVKEAD